MNKNSKLLANLRVSLASLFIRISLVIIFIGYVTWWVYLRYIMPGDTAQMDNFTDTYGIIAGLGAVGGYLVARLWGGWKSLFGRSLSLMSVALFFQFLGQFSYGVFARAYNIDNPYPSFGEIFYFGAFVLNIVATTILAKTLGVFEFGLNTFKKIGLVGIPLALIITEYYIFLKDYVFDWSNPVIIFLDFSYPVLDAIFLALALITFLYSIGTLGGKTKYYILAAIVAMVLQYFANFYFLYESMLDIWEPAGWSDLIYIISYFVLGIVLIGFREAYNKLNSE